MKRSNISSTAIVEAEASLGENVCVWDFSKIRTRSTIGSGTIIGQNVYIDCNVSIGTGCKIQNGSLLYDGVRLGNNVFIGPNVTFTNVINPRAHVDRKSEFKTTNVSDGVTIGAGAVIVCGCSIGQDAFVGAGTVVTRDIPGNALVVGNPSRLVGWVDSFGNKLKFENGYANGSDGRVYSLDNLQLTQKNNNSN